LKEYKGFTLDDDRLKNPDLPFDYFEELEQRIQGFLIYVGQISHEIAKQRTEGEYKKFYRKRLSLITKKRSDFDKAIKQIEQKEVNLR